MSRNKVRMKARPPLFLEQLEQRVNPDAGFRWEVVGASLYFRVDGDSGHPNTATLTTNASFDTVFSCSYVDDDGDSVGTGGSVTAGDIATMQFVTGTTFAGFHVVTGSD